MLRARFDPPELIGGPCVDCGEQDMVLTAGVYDDEEPFALFQVILCRPSVEPTADLRVTLTEWDGAEPVPRESFAVRMRYDAENFVFSFVDNADGDIPGDEEGPAVHCLSRAEALAHARKQEVFAVIDCALKALPLPIQARPGLQ